jgi:hypothetical protein
VQGVLKHGDQLAEQGHRKVSRDDVKLLDKKARVFNPTMDKSSDMYRKLKTKGTQSGGSDA